MSMGYYSSLRCESCKINWPLERDKYEVCPKCKAPTEYKSGYPPISTTEAQAQASDGLFERFLESETPMERLRREAEFKAQEDKRQAEAQEINEQFNNIVDGLLAYDRWYSSTIAQLEEEMAALDDRHGPADLAV